MKNGENGDHAIDDSVGDDKRRTRHNQFTGIRNSTWSAFIGKFSEGLDTFKDRLRHAKRGGWIVLPNITS